MRRFQTQTWAVAALTALCGVTAITPEGMLAANRYSDALPNPSGDFALFTATNYSFETGEASTVWNRLDLESGDISVWYAGDDISEIVFVGSKPTSLLYINGTNEEEDGGISIYFADAESIEGATLIASLPAPYSGLKAVLTSDGNIRFLVYSLAYPNGTAYNEALATEPASSARIYSQIYVRHWDAYRTERLNAVFGGTLKNNNGSYSFDGQLTNYVTGIHNVTYAESPLDLNGADDYDLSPDGSKVAFLTKDVNLPLANFTSSQIYLVDFEGTASDAVPINPRDPNGPYPDAQGASSAPKFSPSSEQIAYFQMNGIYYESDRTILYVASTDAADFNVTRLAGDWDRSPDTAKWASDSSTIYVSAPDLGRERIFPIPLSADDSYVPKNITDEGVAAGFYVLPNSNILVSDSKIWTSRDIYTVTPTGEVDTIYFQANKVDPELAGLSPEDVSEFYYKSNTSEIEQQAWIVYPAGFDESKTYPLAFITHGGPQGAHFNSWSTRWNFKVWADQGYVVIAPNPTASSGWGQNLTDAIQGQWGSYPYWDVVHAWQYVNDTLKYVDTAKGIHAGASFGGYMSNWIQGHEMGRWFQAIVTHDGSTSTLNQWASEELWFMEHDFHGVFNESSLSPGSPYYDWNPILYVDNWQTPHFVVHNDLDFRLPVSEGILLFNLLQVKGVPSKFLNFPDENHWVLNRENSRVWHEEIFKWINYYSGISNATNV
ncbi:dipeptidyl-peptidase V [Pseudomassariella vexata]|uniref:Dipeptidyl-peptidase V n=1 Tax=Pseudomassariella vexata TaxID=1141098 RepID=A0A1Y2DBK2_9PEZI|nr:dipeptidyl-peptidase V [Pseudomassariella vexata]ORY56632.1 dipeptidyl-peptidase V [Pseudomassariella vexata]